MPEKITPSVDTEIEEVLLGLALEQRVDLSSSIIDELTVEDFVATDNRLIFLAIQEMVLESYPKIDEVTVGQRLVEKGQSVDVGGKLKLTQLMSKVPYPLPSQEEVGSYIEILKKKSLRRNMLALGVKLQQEATELGKDPLDSISLIEKELMDLSSSNDKRAVDSPTVMQNAFNLIIDMAKGKPPEGSIKTGIGSLDDTLVINATDFVIIGARPAMGKTAFATNILENVSLEQGKFVALFSLEMSSEQLGARMLLSQSGISSEQMKRGEISDTDYCILEDCRDKLSQAPFIIDDRAPLTLGNIVSRARKLKAERDLGLIIIDYLQLVTGSRTSDGRQQEVSDISRALKLLAKELEVPVVALSQLNRMLENRNDKRPQMSDIRESGSLEQDADSIIFLYRDDYYHPDTEDQGITEAIVAKNRHGKTGTVKMYFSKDTTHFYDLSGGQEQDKKKEYDRQGKLIDESEANEQETDGVNDRVNNEETNNSPENNPEPSIDARQGNEETPNDEPPTAPETDGPPTVSIDF